MKFAADLVNIKGQGHELQRWCLTVRSGSAHPLCGLKFIPLIVCPKLSKIPEVKASTNI